MQSQTRPQSQGLEPGLSVTSQHASKPFLGKCHNKTTSIGMEFHQCQVPELVTLAQLRQNTESYLQPIRQARRHAIFRATNVNQAQLSAYIQFVDQYVDEKDPECFGQGLPARERMHSQALNLLHDMDYNFTKARFFVVFPYYLPYNRFRTCSQIVISDDEMELRIKEHLESLQNCKSKELQRWIQQLNGLLQTRVNMAKITQVIDQGKQNKFDVPEHIKEHIDRAVKIGKDLKKLTGSKMTMEKLKQKRESLSEQSIITNEIVSFEETVNRCEVWINKANEFENEHFLPGMEAEGQVCTRELKPIGDQKIEFKQIGLLVQEYNNLPVQLPQFQVNTKRLHDQTTMLLDKLPLFTKAARTRTNTPTKISYSNIFTLLDEVHSHPVWHPDFENFEKQAHQSMELLERTSMCLEDSRFEKNLKTMAGLVKLVGDLPIVTNITTRLESYVEYVNLIERIRRDIVYPQRFEPTQQLITEAFKKGYNSPELVEFQSKLDLYRGWYQSTQLIKQAEEESLTLLEFIRRQDKIIEKLIDETLFRSQFDMAKSQLNFESQAVEEYSRKLDQLEEQKQRIQHLLNLQQPDLHELINETLQCCRRGLKYPEFLRLAQRLRSNLTALCKMRYILESYQFSMEDRNAFFFKKEEHEELLTILTNRRELKDFFKNDGYKLLEQSQQRPFPRQLVEFGKYRTFVDESRGWDQAAREFVRSYEETSEFDMAVLDRLLDEANSILYDPVLQHRLHDINNVSRWKHSIQSKFEQGVLDGVFNEEDLVDITIISMDMQAIERKSDPDNIKQLALDYFKSNAPKLLRLASKISPMRIQKTHKLPELTKLMKEIEKLTIEDARLTELKRNFLTEINHCETWKDRCIQIRRADRKRPRTQEKAAVAQQQQQPEESMDKRSRTNEFGFYFKLPLLIVQLNNAASLKIVLEELNKLKTLIQQTYSFILKSRQFLKKEKPAYNQLVTLEQEGNKLNIFCIEYQVVKRKFDYVYAWKQMANSVIDSMMILRLEQLKIVKVPEPPQVEAPQPERRQPAVNNEPQQEAEQPADNNAGGDAEPTAAAPVVDTSTPGKRKRKQNPLYNNDDITLLTEDLYSPKLKKRRKNQIEVANPRRTKAQTRKHNKNEQMQKEVEDYYENPAIYCICRMGLMNETSMMMQCQHCEQWFHTECVGIRKSYVKNVREYFCIACSKLLGIRMDYQQSFFWETHVKLPENMFNRLEAEGQQLDVVMDQVHRIKEIKDKMEVWKRNVAKILADLWNGPSESTDESTEKGHWKQLFDLYLQSFWLPTLHLETDLLRGFLAKHK